MNQERTSVVETLSLLSPSTSRWGSVDILNSGQSSVRVLERLQQAVSTLGIDDGIFVGLRSLVDTNDYQPPAMFYRENPLFKAAPLDKAASFVCGPLNKNEAIATSYILETGFLVKDTLRAKLPGPVRADPAVLKGLNHFFEGSEKFIPYGLITFVDYLARMAHYRNIKDKLKSSGIDEDNPSDLAQIVGDGVVILAIAFRQDGYSIGKEFRKTIDEFFVGDRLLFIPFAGVDTPKNSLDWEAFDLGLYTAVRLYRRICEVFYPESSQSSFGG